MGDLFYFNKSKLLFLTLSLVVGDCGLVCHIHRRQELTHLCHQVFESHVCNKYFIDLKNTDLISNFKWAQL